MNAIGKLAEHREFLLALQYWADNLITITKLTAMWWMAKKRCECSNKLSIIRFFCGFQGYPLMDQDNKVMMISKTKIDTYHESCK